MPNYCENELTVRILDHDNEEVQNDRKKKLMKFVEFAKSGTGKNKRDFDFNKFITYPQEYSDKDKKARELEKTGKHIKDGFNSGGYEWCCRHWGTKWNACSINIVEQDLKYGEVMYEFDTAWSPPIPVIVQASKMFPELEFELRFFEQGAGFNGILICREGVVIENRTGDYFGHRGG